MSRAQVASSVIQLALRQRWPMIYRALRRGWWLLRHRRAPPADGAPALDYSSYLRQLRRSLGSGPRAPDGPPVMVLLLGSDPQRLQASIAGVMGQSQSHWQLRVVVPDARVEQLTARLPQASERIRLLGLPENPARVIEGIEREAGDWIALLAEGDLLDPQALARFRQQLAADPDLQLWYCDEDGPGLGVGMLEPWCKTVWDPLRLQAENPVGSFFIVRAAPLLRAARAGLDPAAARQQSGRLLRALSEELDCARVGHSPLILMRRPEPVPAPQPPAPVAEFPLPGSGLSVLVPTRDGLPQLAACVDSVLAAFDRLPLAAELLIIDNGSCQPDTVDYLAGLSAREPQRVRVLRYDRPFNYAAINNWAVAQAAHELLLLLNDDVEATDTAWLAALLRQLGPGVGAVGARLLYPDGRLQHAGIAIGLGGVAGHPCRGLWPQDAAVRHWGGDVVRRMSAVTGACLLTRKSLYLQVEGMNAEHLGVAFNDVDYCLKLGLAGRSIVYTPEATLIHHESISRGADDDLAKQKRFAAEIAYMRQTWHRMIADDPYYSPHWSLQTAELSLRWPVRVAAERCRRGPEVHA